MKYIDKIKKERKKEIPKANVDLRITLTFSVDEIINLRQYMRSFILVERSQYGILTIFSVNKIKA